MTRRRLSPVALLVLALLSCATPASRTPPVSHRAPAQVRLLAFNDFHGQLVPGRRVDGHPAGSAGVLGAWLRDAEAGVEARTVLVFAGDLVSASPAASALLHDEPTVAFVGLFANGRCRVLEPGAPAGRSRFEPWLDPGCNVVGTVGNHEFDHGRAELLRLLGGGDHPDGAELERPWRGARYPTLAANVVDAATGEPILPPFVVKEVDGVKVGFVGLGLPETPTAVTPAGVAGLRFLDAAETANRYVAGLRSQGVRAIVVLVHQGGVQAPYAGPTRADGPPVEGAIVDLVRRLDPEVDVVVSGHVHAFTNALLPNAGGRPTLVTQSLSAGTAFARIDLEVDRDTDDVVAKTAEVVEARADAGPGLAPDPAAAALQARAEAAVAPRVERVVGTAAVALPARGDDAGESPLGDLVADAMLAASPGADVALVNAGGLRTDLPAGPITWGRLFAVQPFGNTLLTLTLTGAQLRALLEQQWQTVPEGRVLQVSNLSYAWSASAPAGAKVSDLRIGGAPVDPAARYRVVTISFLASGGDGFTGFAQGTDLVGGPLDLDAFADHVASRPQPIAAPVGGRIVRRP